MMELPGYEILEKVGEGGMAAVYKARQLSLNRVVALKVVTYLDAPDRDLIERFRHETHIAATVSHPGIVQIYDAGEHEHVAYCVMEFVEGETLGQRLRRTRFIDQNEALRITEGTARALLYAWEEARLIHCDIKPDNILIDKNEVVKVSDLGVARIIGRAVPNLDEGMIIGTPYYSSPEQSAGVEDLDCRTDIYALAATLHQAVTGKVPFSEVDEMEAIHKHNDGFLPDPYEVNQRLKPQFLALMDRMMAKDRSLRQANWTEVLRDISLVRDGQMPEGKALAQGQSTITIGKNRPAPPKLRAKLKMKEPPLIIPVSEPRKRILLTDEFKDVHPTRRLPQRNNVQRVLITLAVLASITLLFYGGMALLSKNQPPPTPVPPPAPAQNPLPVPVPEPDWDQEQFEKARKILVQANDGYQRYLDLHEDPQSLDFIESRARQAVQDLETVRPDAPASADIGTLISTGYQLLSKVRQTRLLDGMAEPSPTPPPEEMTTTDLVSEFQTFVQELLAVEAPDTEDGMVEDPGMESPDPDGAGEDTGSGRKLSLAQNWNRPLMGGKKYMLDDLWSVMKYQGTAKVDLRDYPNLTLFEDLTYLMPAEEAAHLLGQRLPPRNLVNTYGMPSNTLYYYRIPGSFSGAYNILLLVTDKDNQLVAVQLTSEPASGTAQIEGRHFSSERSVYDFILGRIASGGRGSIGYDVNKREDLLEIVAEFKPESRGGIKTRTRLLLPQPIVDLILYRIKTR